MKQQRLFKLIFMLITIISISLACDSDDDNDEKNREPPILIFQPYIFLIPIFLK